MGNDKEKVKDGMKVAPSPRPSWPLNLREHVRQSREADRLAREAMLQERRVDVKSQQQ